MVFLVTHIAGCCLFLTQSFLETKSYEIFCILSLNVPSVMKPGGCPVHETIFLKSRFFSQFLNHFQFDEHEDIFDPFNKLALSRSVFQGAARKIRVRMEEHVRILDMRNIAANVLKITEGTTVK